MAKLLRKKGFTVLEQNYHSRFGEIDVIAQNKDYILFVEVKTRDSDSLIHPFEAITPAKQRKIRLTAGMYLEQHRITQQPRFDAAAVTTENGKIVKTEYLENCFT